MLAQVLQNPEIKIKSPIQRFIGVHASEGRTIRDQNAGLTLVKEKGEGRKFEWRSFRQ